MPENARPQVPRGTGLLLRVITLAVERMQPHRTGLPGVMLGDDNCMCVTKPVMPPQLIHLKQHVPQHHNDDH